MSSISRPPADTATPSAPMSAPATSAIETVHLALRDRIVSGELRPEERLHVARLREAFGVSTSTMREALSRLLNDSLVTSEAQRGFRVRAMSLQDFRDITEAREVIETTAVRASLESRDDDWEAALVAARHKLRQVEDRLIGRPGAERGAALRHQWIERNAAFHDALVANCRNAWLIRFRRTLHRQSHRYHLLALEHDLEHRDVRLEHARIHDAAMADDVETCVAEIGAHIRRTLETMLPALVLD